MPIWTLEERRFPTGRFSQKRCCLTSSQQYSSPPCAAPKPHRLQNGTSSSVGGTFGSQLQWRVGHWRVHSPWGEEHPVLFMVSSYTASACYRPSLHSLKKCWMSLLRTPRGTPSCLFFDQRGRSRVGRLTMQTTCLYCRWPSKTYGVDFTS